MASRSPEWLLVETFGYTEPTIIARASSTKPFLPLDRVIRSCTHRAIVKTALASMTADSSGPRDFVQNDTRYIFIPLTDFGGHLQAILVHYGDPNVPVKAPPECGAWHFNTVTGEASGSCDLLNMYGTPSTDRRHARPMHEAFERLVGNDAEATKKLIQKIPGLTHQATETVRADDGGIWVASYSCRFVPCTNNEVHLHGVTRKVGSYGPDSLAPDPFSLAHQVAAAERVNNVYRTVIDPSTGTLLQSIDPYPDCIEGIRNIYEHMNDQDDIDTISRLLYLCAHDRVSMCNLTAIGTGERPFDFDLHPIDVAGETAVFGLFRMLAD